MTLPKISIITATLNQSHYLEQTITSIFEQKYPALEYIIIDGGSTDGTVELLRNYDDRIKWISEPDNGQSDAINKGLKMVSGDVIGILNSDDIYLNDVLQKIGNFFLDNSQADWVTGKCRIIDEEGREIRKLVTLYKNFFLGLRSKTMLYVLNYISQPATFFRRELIDSVGYFSEDLNYAMDYDYWLRALNATRLDYIPAYLAGFRMYSVSKSGSGFEKQFDEEYKVAKKYHPSKSVHLLHRMHVWLIRQIYTRIS